MYYTVFTEKELLKYHKELLELHKRCCKTYLVQKSLRHSKIKKFFIIYDYYISPKNILEYFHRPIHMFVQALILDKLNCISNYTHQDNGKRKKRNKNRTTKR